MPFGWEILFIFCFVFHSSVEFRNCPVKFCNNIKRQYGRVNSLFLMFFLWFSMRRAQWMIAILNFPASVQTHRYLWQVFDVALWWAVPLQWPLKGLNTPFTVQIKAAALCLSEYLIALRLKQNALCFENTAPICSRSGVVTLKQKLSFFVC